MCTITKKDLIDRISTQTRQRRVLVKRTLQTFLDMVMEELGRGNRLEFRDFGVFEVRTRRARTAQNPKTLQRVPVPPKRTVKFKVGRLLKQQMDVLSGAAVGVPAADRQAPAA
ncbi:MAG: integration host factor subunit beta [Phycisphaerae bacterium]|nr:integration host factor subunit beta [Phycisphaerae bacterium]